MKLDKCFLSKPWGRPQLPAPFQSSSGQRTGEVIFKATEEVASSLLLKFIFTSEKLSVQVHPDDELAMAKGLPHGKTECWYVLDAVPGASVALGFKKQIDVATARSSALDGSIEKMLQWLPVDSGDFFHVPAGTVHAIGAGIALLEIQQNSDVTYRLYDYGRPRELHLNLALQAATLQTYDRSLSNRPSGQATQVLVSEQHFSVVRVEGSSPCPGELFNRNRWIVSLRGTACSRNEVAEAGDCLFLQAGEPLRQSEDALMLVAVEGPLQ